MKLPYIQLARFLAYFQCPAAGCWEWEGAKSPTGYGKVYLNARHMRAHRASYALFYGNFHEDLVVRHRCNNPGCVNPDHLELGTHQDNMDDCVGSGRRPSGEGHYRSQLNETEVMEIRKLLKEKKYPQRTIAAMFGVKRGVISHISCRHTWKSENATQE